GLAEDDGIASSQDGGHGRSDHGDDHHRHHQAEPDGGVDPRLFGHQHGYGQEEEPRRPDDPEDHDDAKEGSLDRHDLRVGSRLRIGHGDGGHSTRDPHPG